jgi:hypothetical protein
VSARRWFAAAVVGYAIVFCYAWVRLPATGVPLHFGLDGGADRFGTRSEALVYLAVLGVAMTALLGGLAEATGRGRLATGYLNVPYKQYWTRPEHEPRMRALMAEDLFHIGAATLALLAVVGLGIVEAARGGASFLPWGGLATVAYCLFMVGWVVRAYTVRYRPPEEP